MFDISSSRRGFLKGGAVVVGFSLMPHAAELFAQTGTQDKTVDIKQVDGFLAIDKTGQVTVYSGKVDLGTGVETALAQMAAEELDVGIDRVTIIQGDTALTPDQGTTFGSMSIANGGLQIRQAAATARQALIAKAATRLNVSSDRLQVTNGVVSTAPGAPGLSYGELVGGDQLNLPIAANVVLKDSTKYRSIGQSVARRDIPPKVTGGFTYMQDFKVPGMLHARVIRPPAMGATLTSVDEASVKDIPGLLKVVRQGNFLAVVGKTEWSAIQAMRTLSVTWSNWAGLPEQDKLWDYVRATPVSNTEVSSNLGDTGAALGSAHRTLKSTYNFAIHTHGSIGPSCAIAQFEDGNLTCWTASQGTHALRRQLAVMFKLEPKNVRAIYLEGAGCYGRNGHEDAAADAALLAKIMDKPVRVQWMRADEHGWDPKGPPTLIDMQAGFDADNRLTAWQSDFFVPDGKAGTVALIAADLAGMPHEDYISPGGVMGNSGIPYRFANVLTRGHRLASTPFRPAWIRSPGRMQNTFANESFLDEIAGVEGIDPMTIRLNSIDPADLRGVEVLKRLASLSKWQTGAYPRPVVTDETVRGRGLAYVKYDLSRTYVAMVADVEVNRKTGKILARKFYVTHDCGLVINPDGTRNQIEGCIVQTLSRTLREELKFDQSTVTSRDWGSYPILTFPEVPEIEIDLIDRPTEPSLGVGEMAAAVVCAAVGNAVFDATGVRLRSIPFTGPKVLAALGRVASANA
jgi:CO/xanthine dehydrogenase Mo-binding subunit